MLSLKPEVLFVIIALFFGIISAFAVPQLSVNDEGAHFLRAYTVSTNNLTAHSCSYPKEVIKKVQESTSNKFSFNISQKDSHARVNYTCGSAASYYPFMHLPQGIGVLLGRIIYDSPAFMVLLGRITNLIFFVIAMYFIIKKVVVGKWVFFVIGSLPITLQAASSLSYDTFNTVVIFAFIATILSLFGQKSVLTRKQIILLALFALLAAMSKSSNIVLLLLIFALPSRLFKQQPTRYSPVINKLAVAASIFLISLVSIFVWQKFSGSTITHVSTHNHLTNDPLYMVVILYNTYINPFFGYSDIFVRGFVGEFSSFQYHLPTSLVVVSFGLITFSLLLKNNFEQKYLENKGGTLSAVSLGIFVLSFLLITYALYTIWATLPQRLGPNATYADGVQGRYFTPLLVLFIPMGIWLRKYIFIRASSQRVSTAIVLLTSVFLLTFYTIETLLFIS